MMRLSSLFCSALAIGCTFIVATGPAHAQQLPIEVESENQDDPLRGSVTDDSSNNIITISVPGLPTPQTAPTPAGSTDELGARVSDVIVADLRSSGLFRPLGRNAVRAIKFDEVTQPALPYWRGRNSEALIQGFVRAMPDGRITVGCYLYDVVLGTELTRQGYVVEPAQWRRAAHKCADSVYSRLTGESPFFDSRIAYIAETGPKDRRTKRLAIMDSDGANHRFITNGQATALTPRFSPDYQSIVYLSFLNGSPSIYIYDVDSGGQRRVFSTNNPTFAPRWSPDGRFILFSMAQAGNTDIYRIPVGGGSPKRLTNAPGIDVGGSYSPDGSKIVFESDRSGAQQIYVMNADGSNQKRISFGGGRYATPEWSPRGDLIAFTRVSGDFRIGTMTPTGGNIRLLTNSWQDEAPTWAPNGRLIQFFRTARGSGKTSLWQVDLTGQNARQLRTPVDGSDPSWGPVLP
jgi:TolB protein